jgi:nucleoside-diphosphate-sugar epimerase
MKNVFITGGGGQDGLILSKIIKKRKKFNLNIILKKKSSFKLKGANYFINNLQEPKLVDQIFSKNKPDIVVHLGSNNPSYQEKSFNKFYLENIKSTINIFESSYKFNKKIHFIFASSSQVFKKKKGIVNEFSKKKINRDYVRFRVEIDRKLSKKKINYTNVILFNHDSKYRKTKFLIPKIIFLLKKNKKIKIQKLINNNICGDFSHAEDICEGIYKIITSKKKIRRIILSSGKMTKINDVIYHLQEKFKINNYNFNFNVNSNKKCRAIVGDNSFAKEILKWKPKKNVFLASEEIYKRINTESKQ